jgi:hypothetical protein
VPLAVAITVAPLPHIHVPVAERAAPLPVFVASGIDLPLVCIRHNLARLVSYSARKLRGESRDVTRCSQLVGRAMNAPSSWS